MWNAARVAPLLSVEGLCRTAEACAAGMEDGHPLFLRLHACRALDLLSRCVCERERDTERVSVDVHFSCFFNDLAVLVHFCILYKKVVCDGLAFGVVSAMKRRWFAVNDSKPPSRTVLFLSCFSITRKSIMRGLYLNSLVEKMRLSHSR